MHQYLNKNIVITGYSSGIGACLATGLKARGYRVIASCRDQQDVDRLKDQGLETIHLDLADSANVESALEYIAENCNRQVFGLVNNGAYGQPGAVIDLKREVLRQQFETNILGTAYESLEKRLEQTEKPRFTLPREAILKSVIHALESRRARVRYRVTTPTKIMSVLKRILPDRMMDAFLEVNSDQYK